MKEAFVKTNLVISYINLHTALRIKVLTCGKESSGVPGNYNLQRLWLLT